MRALRRTLILSKLQISIQVQSSETAKLKPESEARSELVVSWLLLFFFCFRFFQYHLA